MEKLKELPAKAKKAYEFCEKIINASVSKVSEFIKYIGELLSSLSDKVKDAIQQLGGFGDGEENTEKQFLSAVYEYVKVRQTDQRLLAEGIDVYLDKLEQKLAKNKFAEIVLAGKFRG